MAAIISLVALVCFSAGLYLGSYSNYPSGEKGSFLAFISDFSRQDKSVNYSLFEKVWEDVKANYIKQPVDENKLFYGALTGMVASLGDPYSDFLDPETTKAFQNEMSGSFEGIGAEIGIKNDKLMIIAPLSGTPAEKAGLKPMDQILQIDGQDTSQMTLDYATSSIRGKKGTEVKLLILSEGDKEAREVSLKRDEINVVSVRHSVKSAGENGSLKLGYIEILTFSDDTVSVFKKTVNDLLGQGIKGIVLDLRNNPGGYLDSAVTVASQFIEKGPIVIEEFSDQTKKTYEAEGGALLADYPVVVLINNGSASAAEILAGALKDDKNAILVGESSFGKGSVQEYEELADGSSLKLTTAKWLTPKGISINDQGLTPDYTVALSQDDYDNNKDPQLDKAVEVILSEITK